MRIVGVVTLSIVTTILFVSPTAATVCAGPDLANIAVLSNGMLEVQGSGRVARSSDQGRTWKTIPGLKPSLDPFWKRGFKDSDGVLYQNIIVNGAPVVIYSKDNGRTWEHKRFASGGLQSLIVWSDTLGLFRIYGNDLRYSDASPGIGAGFIEGLHGPHDRAADGSSAVGDNHRFVSFEYDGATLALMHSEFVASGTPLNSVAIGRYITGLFISPDRTIYISTESKILRGRNFGRSWEELNIPVDWIFCNGDPPREQSLKQN